MEEQMRQELRCRGCGAAKELGAVVCWDCFKGRGRRREGLKTFAGTVEQWLASCLPVRAAADLAEDIVIVPEQSIRDCYPGLLD